jgi:hypothetical protein
MVIGAMSCGDGGGVSGAPGGGGAGGRVVSSLTETWDFARFLGLAEAFRNLANGTRKTNKKRRCEHTLSA